MNNSLSFYAMLASTSAARVYDAVRVTLRATLLLAGCPATQARG
jgi:hypothetical protein